MTNKSKLRAIFKILIRDCKTFCECDICHKTQEDILDQAITQIKTELLGKIDKLKEEDIICTQEYVISQVKQIIEEEFK